MNFPRARLVAPTPLLRLAALFCPLATYSRSASINGSPGLLLYTLLLFRSSAFTYSVDLVTLSDEALEEPLKEEKPKTSKPLRIKKPGNA